MAKDAQVNELWLTHFSPSLIHAEEYMDKLSIEIENLRAKKITDKEVEQYIEILLPLSDGATDLQEKNILKLRTDLRSRYYDAPDLKNVGNNAYRWINAVSDFATHMPPLRKTANYKENLFSKTIDGNPLIDKAYQLIAA